MSQIVFVRGETGVLTWEWRAPRCTWRAEPIFLGGCFQCFHVASAEARAEIKYLNTGCRVTQEKIRPDMRFWSRFASGLAYNIFEENYRIIMYLNNEYLYNWSCFAVAERNVCQCTWEPCHLVYKLLNKGPSRNPVISNLLKYQNSFLRPRGHRWRWGERRGLWVVETCKCKSSHTRCSATEHRAYYCQRGARRNIVVL